jgi:hypothetical protein
MRIMRLIMDKEGRPDYNKSWLKSKIYNPDNARDLLEANLRDLYTDEVVLDVETKYHSMRVKIQLDKEGYYYKHYDTGSRGEHFHLIIEGLDKLSERERVKYREHMINHFNTDIAKKSGFIAMEDKPHLKTGNYKRLISQKEGINKLNLDILTMIRKEMIKIKKPHEEIEYDQNLKESLRRQVKVSDILNKWNIDTRINPTDTPFGGSKRKRCFSFNDNKGLWYDHHHVLGGDIYTLVMQMKNVNFPESIELIKKGEY